MRCATCNNQVSSVMYPYCRTCLEAGKHLPPCYCKSTKAFYNDRDAICGVCANSELATKNVTPARIGDNSRHSDSDGPRTDGAIDDCGRGTSLAMQPAMCGTMAQAMRRDAVVRHVFLANHALKARSEGRPNLAMYLEVLAMDFWWGD